MPPQRSEKYLNGLLKGPALSRRNVFIGYVDGRGRSAFVAKEVCKYGAVRRVHKKGEGKMKSTGLLLP